MAVKEHVVCENIQWIDITDPTVQEMDKLSADFHLNAHTVKDSMEPEHLPKYDYVDDIHFLIIRFYTHKSDSQAATIQDLSNKIAIFYTDRFIITIHRHEVPFLAMIQKKFVGTGKCNSTTEVLTKILWNALETFDDPAQRLSEQVDFYETSIMLRNANNTEMQALYFIKRQASIAHKILMLMLEPINHIQAIPRDDPALQDVRDQHLKMQTLFNQVLDDVNNLMNFYISQSAHRTSEVMKVLTIFSAFFLPLTFVVGIYGMNFEFMPELSSPYGYPVIILVMIIITASIFFWFRKKKWL